MVVPDRPIRQKPFPRFSYREAMDRFGSDKPDVRFEMELQDVGDGGGRAAGSACSTRRSRRAAESSRLAAPGMAGASRSQIDELTEVAKRAGAKGLVHLSVTAEGAVTSPIAQVPGRGEGARRWSRRPARRPATSCSSSPTGHPRSGGAGQGARRAGRAAGAGQGPQRAVVHVGLPLPDVPVGRREQALGRHAQPVLGRRAGRRASARHRVRRSFAAVAGRPRRPGACDAVRHRAERLGAWRWVGAHPSRATFSRVRSR